jgi:hypothetical protein
MRASRSWSLIAMGADQQYAGNKGYEDDPRRVYSYDNTVPNSAQLSRGDLVFIRDGAHLVGAARVINVTSGPGKKTRNRCPICGTTDLKIRAYKQPKFRCSEKHEFEVPREEAIDVTVFRAVYESSFERAREQVPVRFLKNAAIRRNDQLAIEEISPSRLLNELRPFYPRTFELITRMVALRSLTAVEAQDEESDSDLLASKQVDGYEPSDTDTRRRIERQIRVRRGQARFRNALRKRYGDQCQVSGCELLDVLEAAHIWPLRGDTDNHPENGLLLRSDLHTLFDLFLFSIDPDSLEVQLAPDLLKVDLYKALQAKKIRVSRSARPALEPLRRHWRSFQSLRFGAALE